jgi:hypothetical protein
MKSGREKKTKDRKPLTDTDNDTDTDTDADTDANTDTRNRYFAHPLNYFNALW